MARSVFGGTYFAKRPMHDDTRRMLTDFFEDHWHAKWSVDAAKMDKVAGDYDGRTGEECRAPG